MNKQEYIDYLKNNATTEQVKSMIEDIETKYQYALIIKGIESTGVNTIYPDLNPGQADIIIERYNSLKTSGKLEWAKEYIKLEDK